MIISINSSYEYNSDNNVSIIIKVLVYLKDIVLFFLFFSFFLPLSSLVFLCNVILFMAIELYFSSLLKILIYFISK